MAPISINAPAKLNMFLHVGPARDDGYHDLFSFVAFTSFGDRLQISEVAGEDDGISLTVGGGYGGPLNAEGLDKNLVVRAGRALQDWARRNDLPVKNCTIALTKELPVAAGIGGGSADAAGALRGLCELWNYHPSQEDMDAICVSLGADVPVCFAGATSWMGGIGEQVSEAPSLTGTSILLVNPRVPLSTGPVFRAFDDLPPSGMPLVPEPLPRGFETPIQIMEFLAQQRNDLENPAIALCPDIKTVLDALRGAEADLVRMSGSGPTCFALFANAEKAAEAATVLSRVHPGWWVQPSVLL